MKIYKGLRTPKEIVVTVDGAPLDPHTEVRNLRASGFEWGYVGSGPRQLALAIMADHYDAATALRRYRDFTEDVIAEIQADEWTLTSDDIYEQQDGVVYVDMDLETLFRKVRGEID